jgi:hypothetical protein
MLKMVGKIPANFLNLLKFILIVVFLFILWKLLTKDNYYYYSATKNFSNYFNTNNNKSHQSAAGTVEKESSRGQVVILFMPWFEGRSFYFMNVANKFCSPNCLFTEDASLWNESSAVIFHARNLQLNGSERERLVRLRNRTPETQRWIWFNQESPTNTQVQLKKTKLQDRNLFNWTFSYRRDSDFVADYGHIYPKSLKLPPFLQKYQDSVFHQELSSVMPSPVEYM